VKGPRIIKALSRNFGACRNLTALHIKGLVVPIFYVLDLSLGDL
jgi:hypothetical protein